MDSNSLPLGGPAEPLKFHRSGRTVSNRIMKAALSERLASWDINDRAGCGVPSKELLNLYKSWGKSGYGIIITGNIMIDTMNIEAPGNMIIPKGERAQGPRFAMFRQLATYAQSSGSLLLGQLNHPGRQIKGLLQPKPVSASAVSLGANDLGIDAEMPREASKEDIQAIVDNFAHSAEYLERAGFGGIQLHAAHGYLLGQFLSKNTNMRGDEYGPQSMANRARLLCEVASAVKQRTRPDFVLSAKINSIEFEAGGLQPADTAVLCSLLDGAGFDMVEMSGGTYKELAFAHRRDSTRRREAFFMEFVEQILSVWKSRHCKVFVTGGFRTARAIWDAMRTVDGIGLGRPSTQNCDLPHRLLGGHVNGAAKLALDPDEYFKTSAICGSQMRQIGELRQPMDATLPATVLAYFEDFREWTSAKCRDPDMLLYKPMKWIGPDLSAEYQWSDDLRKPERL